MLRTHSQIPIKQPYLFFVLMLLCCLTLIPIIASAENNMPVAVINYLLNGNSLTTRIALNDTGITYCADESSNTLSCPVDRFPGQDAEYGRDKTDNNNQDGHAGFSFNKLDNNGQIVDSAAPDWSCVKDNVTGLIWEVKTKDGGLYDHRHNYTWYDPNGTTNGGDVGVENGGFCYENGYCDTVGFVTQVNQQGLCGASDWRLPTISELESLVSLEQTNPAFNTFYFPYINSWTYWSATASAYDPEIAWGIYFYEGSSYASYKYYSAYIRLVRIEK